MFRREFNPPAARRLVPCNAALLPCARWSMRSAEPDFSQFERIRSERLQNLRASTRTHIALFALPAIVPVAVSRGESPLQEAYAPSRFPRLEWHTRQSN